MLMWLVEAILLTAVVVTSIAQEDVSSCANVPKPVTSACFTCDRCNNGLWECDPVDCSLAQCVDGHQETGKCCQTCPNGPNCRYFNVVIPKDRVVVIDSRLTCTCVESGDDNGTLMAKCLDNKMTNL